MKQMTGRLREEREEEINRYLRSPPVMFELDRTVVVEVGGVRLSVLTRRRNSQVMDDGRRLWEGDWAGGWMSIFSSSSNRHARLDVGIILLGWKRARSVELASRKKRPIQSSELESQISQLQEDLKKMKEQLKSCESSNSQVQQEADEVKKQLTAKSAKIEELQLQLLEFSTAEDNRLEMLSKISQEHNSKQHLLDSTTLLSAMNEIQWMKQQLDVMKSETGQSEDSKMKKTEIYTLKEEMAGTLSNIENLKIKNGERGLTEEKQLEIANTTIQSLRADGYNFLKSLNSVTSKLEESKVRVSVLEELLMEYQIVAEDNEADRRNPPCKVECGALQLELEQLGVALKAAEA
ncbi:hypothetical protein KFK09_014199 [Dendrobium nobile]|uniref:Uncharacterized protein n=1 Tax=Dendrobium nobile TaxID=94219 RepID=A0A8T3BB13_DENNO|nr:hypothetical protein KFK09_014199 [Dendrobium nobile]